MDEKASFERTGQSSAQLSRFLTSPGLLGHFLYDSDLHGKVLKALSNIEMHDRIWQQTVTRNGSIWCAHGLGEWNARFGEVQHITGADLLTGGYGQKSRLQRYPISASAIVVVAGIAVSIT